MFTQAIGVSPQESRNGTLTVPIDVPCSIPSAAFPPSPLARLGGYARPPRFARFLREPGSAPSAGGLAMSNVLDEPTRFPCSTLRVSLSIPMPTAAWTCPVPPSLKLRRTRMQTVIARAVTIPPSPRLRRARPAASWNLLRPPYGRAGSTPRLPGRSAAADGGTSTLPLFAPIVAPLIEVSDVAGNASAAPRHEQRRAARERAGMRQALRAYRTGEHRIIGVDYATLPFPAHTRAGT